MPRKPATAPVGESPAPTRRRRTQAERREESEQKILEATLEIVARQGSVRMTLADVGEAAGYSRGLPALRFGSKAGLLRALAASIGTRFTTKLMTEPEHGPGLASIRRHITIYFDRRGGDWTTTRALLMLMAEGIMENSEVRELIAEYNRARVASFEDDLRQAIQNGEVDKGVDVQAASLLLLGALRGAMMQWLLDPSIQLERLRDEMLAMVDSLRSPRRKAAPRTTGRVRPSRVR